MTASYELTHESLPDALVVRASGKFDRAAGEAVEALLGAHSGSVVLNLADVAYLSSTGIAFLARLTAARGLRVAAASATVRATLSLAGIDKMLALYPDEGSARRG